MARVMLDQLGMHSIHKLLHDVGQSVWLDYLDRRFVTAGDLERAIARDGIRGLTSNPTIFEKSIAGSNEYDDIISDASDSESDASVLERIEVREIARACDAFRNVYDESRGADGFVSIEVSPSRAHDSTRSIDEARRLASRVARPNVMVKIPGTREGLGAIEQCLAEGINVNVTLLFSVERYEKVANAYLNALEARKRTGLPIDRIASVASFFVSRVDGKVDRMLDSARAPLDARGRAGIANAVLAYEAYQRLFSGPRWEQLAASGARPQRLLWASTTPKNATYGACFYANALALRDTVDTMAKETLRAFISSGDPKANAERDPVTAKRRIADLGKFGIDFARVVKELEDDGIDAFAKSFETAKAIISKKRKAIVSEPDFASEAQAKRTEFGDAKRARAMTGRGL